MRRVLVALLLVAGCSSTSDRPARVENLGAEKHCLKIARIYRSEIVDDQTILFHMRDGAIWRNRLPNKCYGLRMQGGFGYATALDMLCDLDIIQVLGGSRSVCGLGRFEPYEPPEGIDANAYDAAP